MLKTLEKNAKEIEKLNSVVATIDALIYVIDLQNYKILFANQNAIEEFGDIENKVCYSVLQKDKTSPCKNCSLLNPMFLKIIGKTFKWEQQNSLNNKIYLFSDKVIEWNDGRLVKVQIGIDITKQKKLEKEITLEKDNTIQAFEALSNSTIEGLMIFNEQKKLIKVNEIAPKLLGYKIEEMLGRNAIDFIAPSHRTLVRKVINNENQEPYESRMIKKDGTTFPVILRGKNIQLGSQKVRVSAIMDITNIKEKEEEISKLAYFDSLTLLPNRTMLEKAVNRFMTKSSRDETYGALMFIDLDDFKTVNDTKGHLVGDKILIECAKRLKKIVREYDTVSRFGGDEFVILFDAQTTNKENAGINQSLIAKKILSEIKKTIYIKEFEFTIGASIGIVLFKGEDKSLNELMKYADSAMYHAKEIGKNNFCFFDPKLQEDIERSVYLTEKLKKSIENNELEVYYQTQVNSFDEIIGVEFLLRWFNKELGFVSPEEFIPIAEESGYIITLGEFVLKEAIKYLKKWEKDEIKSLWRISINVSLLQFEKDDFILLVQELVLTHNIQASRLRLEITESFLLKDKYNIIDKINFLKRLGITLSIDDFGTGYSSLSYLKKLPIDELKIDRSFIKDILDDESDEVIVQAIFSIGKKFGFDVIAEGVETKALQEKLILMNCKYFQGYYFGKPKPITNL